MDRSVRYHSLFDCDVREAAGYYERHSIDLAIDFVDAVEARTARVIAHPTYFGIAFDSVRFANIRRFPYIILFEQDHNELRIYGVFHSATNPARWRGRVDDMKSG